MGLKPRDYFTMFEVFGGKRVGFLFLFVGGFFAEIVEDAGRYIVQVFKDVGDFMGYCKPKIVNTFVAGRINNNRLVLLKKAAPSK